MDFNNDLDISSPDEMNFFSNNKQAFSHEFLVMRAYQKVQDSLGQEMVNGYNSIEKDNNGRDHIIYHKDTRHESIEAIKTLKNTMISDLVNTGYIKEINRLLKELKDKYKYYLNLQYKYYDSMNINQKRDLLMKYPDFIEVMSSDNLYPEFVFSDTFISSAVEIYREIFEQLELCLFDRKYFKKAKNRETEF